jgi:uncharacterized protein
MNDIVIIGDYKFNTLVAITEEEHNKGLMWKKAPTPIMSFPYDKPEVHKFWMQNTIAPLDILFCRAGKVIDIQKGSPFSVDLIGPDENTDLVVELPLGTVEKYNIATGSNIHLKYSTYTLSRKYSIKLAF